MAHGSMVLLLTASMLASGCRSHSLLHEQDDARTGAATSASLPSYRPPPAVGDGWDVARADAEGLSVDKLTAMERAIRAGDFPKLTSVVIARHGKLVHEAYFGETDRASLHDTRSVTKTVTGMLLGIAIDKGLVSSVDVPLTSFFSDKRPFANPDPRKDKITLEDLLTMSSVLECNDWDDESRGNEERMYVEKDWVKFALDIPARNADAQKALEKAILARTEPKDAGRSAEAKDRATRAEAGAHVAARDAETPTGRRFSYCTAGAGALGSAVERAAKTPLADFANNALFGPLGIDRAIWRYSPSGAAFAGGGLALRSRDLLKLAQLYLDGGTWKGVRVVPESWVKRSVLPYARIDDKTEYGYLWWLRSFLSSGRPSPTWYMSGNGGNKVVVVPDLGLVAVLTSGNYNTKGMHVVTDRLLQDFVLAAVVN
jgi:CubicO group peptidase (beta-lactamase class C family)